MADFCLPKGTIGHSACHAEDAEIIARLRAVVREVEWRGPQATCPVCGGAREGPFRGHTRDCRLKAALEGRDG